MSHLSRTLAVIAIVAGALIGVGGLVAYAQSTTQSAQRSAGGVRGVAPAAAPTAPPLPYGDQSRSSQGARRSTVGSGSTQDIVTAFARMPASKRMAYSRLVPFRGHAPAIPKLTDLLKHKARFRLSASGGTIVLTGTSTVPYLDDQTLSYGSNVYWLCQNLKPNTFYQYIVFPPDGTAYQVEPHDYIANNTVAGGGVPGVFSTDNAGRCGDNTNPGNPAAGLVSPFYAHLTLSTPLAGTDTVNRIGGTPRGSLDSPYSGVWAIAVQDMGPNSGTPTAGAYEAVAYAVVLGTLNFATFSDAGFTTKANDFTSGSTVYVSASGLNPAHFYSYGFVNTSGNGIPCVFSIPAGAQNWNNGTCFTTNANGILPTSQQLTGQYTTPSSGGNSVGTDSVELYDATTNDLISTQQISLNPSAVVWSTLQPVNGVTTGTNLNDTFATDGLLGTPGGGVAEQSVTGLNYQVSGLTSGHTYSITVSNANGVILSSTNSDSANPGHFFSAPQFFSPPAQFTATSTSSGLQQVLFPINVANFTSFGATQIPFAPNVYTAQLYDVTAGTVVGSKSFTVVSYGATFQWTNPAGSYVNANAGGAATNVTTTLRNSAGTLYGNWNGDSIKAITINNDSGGLVTLGLQGGVTTATDSIGQTWNITRVSGAQITLTPAVAGQSLPPNATIPIPITVAVAAGNCTTACVLRTQITPLHGINPSNINNTMTTAATNGLDVYGNGVVGTNTQATYSFQVGAYTGPSNLLGTPRYNQMMYRSGTDGAATGTYNPPTSYYALTVNVTNNGPRAITYIEFVMPATVDPNAVTPAITSATVNGSNQTARWSVLTQNGSNGTTSDPTLGPNAFALGANNSASPPSIGTGRSATFVLKMPILLSAFPFQEIPATANYCQTGTSNCTVGGVGASFAMAPTNALTNAVAGTTNIDSTELGAFSLDTALMTASISPAVVPALANQNWTFKFLNTSTGLDPNPDYVSQLLVTVPAAGAGIFPTVQTVTASNGATWNANPTGTQGQWLIDLCAVNTAPVGLTTQSSTPCAGTTDQNALPPGGTLTINFNYASAPAVGNYNVNWTVVGANGGGVVAATAAQIPQLVVQNTTAQTSFTFADGYTATPSYPPVAPIQAVTAGSQPTVGSWADFNNGNGYVFELLNNGSTTLTNVSLAIPWANTSGQLFDTANPWNVIASSIHVYGAGAGAGGSKCLGNSFNSLVQAVNGSPGTSGLLTLSGCNIAVGQKLDIFFYAKTPYDVGSTFRFDTSVATGGATPADPRVSGNPNTLASYSLANTVRVVSDARLAIQIPVAGPTYNPALNGNSSAVPACGGCSFSTAGALPLINLNQITGTFTTTDTLAASVYSDDTSGWNLSVSADVNPASNASGQLYTLVDSTHSTVLGGYTPSQTTFALVPNSTNLALSNFTGTVGKRPIDNIMSFQVNVNPLSVNNNTTTTVTLTYTLVAN